MHLDASTMVVEMRCLGRFACCTQLQMEFCGPDDPKACKGQALQLQSIGLIVIMQLSHSAAQTDAHADGQQQLVERWE